MIFKSNLTPHFQKLLKALNSAINRFDQSRMSNSPADSFESLGDALQWINTIDNHWIETDGSAYKKRCRSNALGEIILGHRYIRNLLTHSSKTDDLVNIVNGVHYPVRFPVCPFELKWKPFTELPTPRIPNRELAKCYVKHVENNLARETLRKAAEFFRGLLESEVSGV